MDIGAHIGYFSMYAGALGAKEILAIEPVWSSVIRLFEGFKRNRFASQVSLLWHGVAQASNTLKVTRSRLKINIEIGY